MKPSFFSANRNSLRQQLSLDSASLALFPAHTKMQFHSDQAGNFLQESNFYYLSGITRPDCLLVIGFEQEFLLIPDSSTHADIWDGQLDEESATKASAIDTIFDTKSGWQQLKRLLSRKIRTVYLAQPEPEVSFDGTYSNPSQRKLVEKIHTDFPLIQIKDVRPFMAQMRAIKQPEEIKQIKKSVSITADSLKDAIRNLKHGQNEQQIDAELEFGFKKRGSSGTAFQNIVAAGKRACTVHYTDNNQVMKKGDLVVIDTGARVNGYAADITRTIAVEGSLSKRQEEVVQAVKSVYDFAKSAIKTGGVFMDYEKSVEAEMGRVLKGLGLIERAEPKFTRKYFPHATSHMLGLDVHDVGTDPDTTFSENMVLTIEPGIYIPDESIGVRIEDDFLITKDGVENLSPDLSQLM